MFYMDEHLENLFSKWSCYIGGSMEGLNIYRVSSRYFVRVPMNQIIPLFDNIAPYNISYANDISFKTDFENVVR